MRTSNSASYAKFIWAYISSALSNKQMAAEFYPLFYDRTRFAFPRLCLLNTFLHTENLQRGLLRKIKLSLLESILNPPNFTPLHRIEHLQSMHIEFNRSGILGLDQSILRSLEQQLRSLKSWIDVKVIHITHFSSPRPMSAEEIKIYSARHSSLEDSNLSPVPAFWHGSECDRRHPIWVSKTSTWFCGKGGTEWKLVSSKIVERDMRRISNSWVFNISL